MYCVFWSILHMPIFHSFNSAFLFYSIVFCLCFRSNSHYGVEIFPFFFFFFWVKFMFIPLFCFYHSTISLIEFLHAEYIFIMTFIINWFISTNCFVRHEFIWFICNIWQALWFLWEKLFFSFLFSPFNIFCFVFIFVIFLIFEVNSNHCFASFSATEIYFMISHKSKLKNSQQVVECREK